MGIIKVRDIDAKKSVKIEAHKHPVKCIGMDYMGRYLASSSSKGTIIRIFRLDTMKCIQELRRGMDNASILSLNFNLASTYLGCSSDSGTVHIFSVKEYFGDAESVASDENGEMERRESNVGNRKRLTFLRKAIPYFNSEWSSSSLRVKEKRVICDFNWDSKDVLIYVKHGRMYR
jgi:WD40 repeat protein